MTRLKLPILGLLLVSSLFAQLPLPGGSSGGGGASSPPVAGYGITVAGYDVAVDTAVIPSIASVQAGTPLYCRSTTSSATMTCSLATALTGYTNGMCLVINSNFANVTTATINVNGQGAKSVFTRTGGALSAGDIPLDKGVIACYDGTNFNLQNGGGGSVSRNGLYLTISGTDYIPENLFAATKPPQTGWSWVGTAGTEAFGSDGSQALTGVASTLVMRSRAITTETVAIVAFRCDATTNTAGYSYCAVFLRESATGKGPIYQYSLYGSYSAPYGASMLYQSWALDTYSSGIFNSPISENTMFVKMDWSTANVVTSRWTGTTWRQINSTAKSSLFTTAPNQLVFAMGSQTPANIMTILSLQLL